MNDVDVADVYGITVLQKMHVYLKNGINWTTILVEDFIQDLREDVEFDGMDSQMDNVKQIMKKKRIINKSLRL